MGIYKIDVTDESFDENVIEQSNKVPVVVDFWASWCGPCMMLKPVLEKIAEEYHGKFVLAKLNVEENQEKAGEYGVMSIPSIKMFKNGEIVDEFVGAMPESAIKEWLNNNLD